MPPKTKKSKLAERRALAAATGGNGKDGGNKNGDVFHFVTVNPTSEDQKLENRTLIRSHASKYIWRQHRAVRATDAGSGGPAGSASASASGNGNGPGLAVRQYSGADVAGKTVAASRRRGQAFKAWSAGTKEESPFSNRVGMGLSVPKAIGMVSGVPSMETIESPLKESNGGIHSTADGNDEVELDADADGDIEEILQSNTHDDDNIESSDSEGSPPPTGCRAIAPHIWTPDPLSSVNRNNTVNRPFNQLINWLENPGQMCPSMLEESAISKLMRYAAFDLWPGLVLGAQGQRWDREAAAGAWLPRAMANPALFTAFLYGAAGHMQTRRRLDSVQVVPQTREEKLEQIVCESETVKQLNKMMKDPSQAFSDEVVLAVLCMAFNRIDYSGWTVSDPSPKAPLRNLQWLDVYGGLSLNDQHVKGLMAIIETRGGLKSLKLPGLAETLSTSGVMLSTKYLCPPRLPFVPIFKETALGQTPNWPSLNPTATNNSNGNTETPSTTSPTDASSSSSTASNTLNLLLSTRPMQNSIPTYPLSPVPPTLQVILQNMREYNIVVDLHTQGLLPNLELSVIADRRNYIQYNLVSLPTNYEFPDDYNATYRLHEACRLAAMVYSMLVIFPLPAANRPFKTLVAGLINALADVDVGDGRGWEAERGEWPWNYGREEQDRIDPEEDERVSYFNMADNIKIGNLSLNDSQHAPNATGRSAYIPPHLRGQARQAAAADPTPGPAPVDAMDGHGPAPGPQNGRPAGMNASAWAPGGGPNNAPGWGAGDFAPRGGPAVNGNSGWGQPAGSRRAFDPHAYGHPGHHGGQQGGGNYSGGGGAARGSGDGQWRDGKHVPGPSNARVERELFGIPNDPSKQQTGINFANYDDIPVEASGHNVPEPVTTFTNPPLDDHLISNIKLASYKVPTPVQKYSIPIVMGGRDLMACAQTGSGKTGGFLFPILSQAFQNGPSAAPTQQGGQFSYGRQRKAYPTSLILAPT
ncbi:hypothetical protein FQN49_003187, partial [Arthroderma sp. PD_2]